MNIKIASEEELVDKFKKAVHILNNLRKTTKDWKEHLGHLTKDKKERWEETADKFLEELGVSDTKKKYDIHIENI